MNDNYLEAEIAALNLLIIGKAVMLTAEKFNPLSRMRKNPIINASQLAEGDFEKLEKRHRIIENREDYIDHVVRFESFCQDYEQYTGETHELDALIEILFATRDDLNFDFDPYLDSRSLTEQLTRIRYIMCEQVATHHSEAGFLLRQTGVTPSVSFYTESVKGNSPFFSSGVVDKMYYKPYLPEVKNTCNN
tara:strand:+ start:1314 stop:1886 length:573 start_codon:yes stop_codon:yes gene_type:complete